MEAQANWLLTTHVEKEGPFLKVWGQTDKSTSLYVEQVLQSYSSQFDNGLCIPHPETLQIGVLCCAKYKDNKYYRTRITSLNFLHNRYIEVSFVDFGHRDVVPVSNIRSLDGFDSAFISIPPQASCFLLAEAVCPRGEWNDVYLDEISKELRYTEVHFTIITQVTKYFLIRLYVGASDLALLLISRGLMRHTALTTQEAVLLAMMPRSPQQAHAQQSIATYKAFTLEPGSQYEVYVSYVTDGPCNFSIQLKQSEEALGKLMKEVNSMNLTPLEGIPLPGNVCLARCQEDGHICRAVVTNELDGNFKVFFVDFGNFEVVPIDALYEIPFKYVIPKVMAIRFALAGVEKSTVTLEMQCAFKQFVDNRLIHMKVMPMTARTALPRCELWDPESHISALDIVNHAAAAAYPEHLPLNRGFSQPIKISYVFSCNRFFVQLKSKEDDLMRLMLEIQSLCQKAEPLVSNALKVGLPCYALFEADLQWYRSQVVDVISHNQVKVQYVDFGNEELVNVSVLRPIEGKALTVLRPQAIECCLNGYQNMEPDLERDNLLEELILEKEFVMKVVEMQGKKALIELIDASNYNVASLLLERIAQSKSQASPMLVQAGNKIEHRKPFNNAKEQRRNERKESTDGDESSDSWRQNQKASNKNQETQNEPNETERRNNRPYGNNERSFEKPERGSNKYNNRNNDRTFEKPNGRANSNEREFEKPRGYDRRGAGDADGFSPNNRGFNKNRDRPPRDSNRNDWSEKKSFNQREKPSPSDDWAASPPEQKQETPDWNDSGNKKENTWGAGRDNERKGFQKRDDNFKKGNRFNNEGDWNSEGANKGGFRKKSDFKREGSVSSSGSDTGFRKTRDNGRNRNNPDFDKKKFDRPPRNANKPNEWENKKTAEVPDAAPSTAQFQIANFPEDKTNIVISWFHNPSHFYCLIENTQGEFKKMMEDIQQAYKDRLPSSAPVGSPVIGLFPEDNVLYRAQVLECLNNQYKVQYVDFGNISLIEKVWPIENRFMKLPAQALCCQLDSIQPPSGNWPEAGTFSQYFNKPQFLCQFISNLDDRFSVKLEHESHDIGELLLKDGHAIVVSQAPTIELSWLLAQQFRGMLLSVNSLEDFVVSLQDGHVLSCSVFNFGISTETWLDTLKEKLNQVVIVFVDNVLEDKLEVTLYDSFGSKIKLIDGDESAYETVEILCSYLITSPTLVGEVSHVENDIVYVQPEDCLPNIEYILDAMHQCYEITVLENAIVPVEGYIYAVKSTDGNWYRGKVTSFDDNTATVMYVDYGNSESVQFSTLRELSAEFMEITLMCVPVIVENATEDLCGTWITLTLEFTEKGLVGAINTTSEPEAIPEVESLPEAAPLVCSIPETIQEGALVILSHADSPNDFYLQLLESSDSIAQLQSTLQEQSSSMVDMESSTVGVLCAAPYSLDQQWYRAQVLDADADITTVRFVDYGNTDVLDNTTTKVKTLPPHLLSLEMHATRCRLKIKPIEEEWSSSASERFEALCGVDNLVMQYISQEEKANYVELFSDGISVAELLISEKLALLDESSVETKAVGFVSHLNSPSEFWIQLESCIDELEWVAEQLSGVETFPDLKDLAPGTLCAALFPDDQMWYRARILSNTIAGIEVLFVDYGNSCTSCSLRELPEDLVMLAPLAQKCSLQKPAALTNWGPEMCKKFSDISADGQTTFAVKRLSTGETALVELMLDEVDVVSMLLPVTESVTVKSCETLEQIVLVKEGKELETRFKLEELTDLSWNESSVRKLEEINKEVVFEAEFVSEDIVRLYLGLNDVRLELPGTKTNTPTSTPVKMRSEVKTSEDTVVEDIMEEIITECVPKEAEVVAKTEAVSSSAVEHEVLDNTEKDTSSTEPEVVEKTETISSSAVEHEVEGNTEKDTSSTGPEVVVKPETISSSAVEHELVENTEKDTSSTEPEVVENTEAVSSSAVEHEVVDNTEKDTSSTEAEVVEKPETISSSVIESEVVEKSETISSSTEAEVVEKTETNTSSTEPEVVEKTETISSSTEPEVVEKTETVSSSALEPEVVDNTETNTSSTEPEVVENTKTNSSSGAEPEVSDLDLNGEIKDLVDNLMDKATISSESEVTTEKNVSVDNETKVDRTNKEDSTDVEGDIAGK